MVTEQLTFTVPGDISVDDLDDLREILFAHGVHVHERTLRDMHSATQILRVTLDRTAPEALHAPGTAPVLGQALGDWLQRRKADDPAAAERPQPRVRVTSAGASADAGAIELDLLNARPDQVQAFFARPQEQG